MGKKSKPAALAEQAADSVTDAASQLKSNAADAASQLRSGAADAASQIRSSAQDTAHVASQQLNEKRGRSGIILALLVMVIGGVVWWRTQQS
ncbi:MAG: hypothetical protein NVSMB51_03680 [Solirubrobacteraceae bacterium]